MRDLVGFFSRKQSSDARTATPDDTALSREYLASVPVPHFISRPPPRKSSLWLAVLNQVAELPIASGKSYGKPVSRKFGLGPAIALVQDVMTQDRSVHGRVARDAVGAGVEQLLESLDGPADQRILKAWASIGLARTGGSRCEAVGPYAEDLSGEESREAERLGGIVLELTRGLVCEDNSSVDSSSFIELATSPTEASRVIAEDVIAVAAVMVARTVAVQRIEFPLIDPALAHAPKMTEPGWYPNPPNYGEIEDGVPSFERYWDGDDWTDQVRARVKRTGEWAYRDISIYELD